MKALAALERPFYAAIQPLVGLLVRLRIRPNSLTTVGVVFVLASAWVYARGDVRLGGALLLTSGFIDTLDGEVARASGAATTFGAFYDSTLDRVGDGLAFLGIGAWLLQAPGVAWRVPGVILCMVAIVLAMLVSYARARAEGLGVDCAVGIAQRAERVVGVGVVSVVAGASYEGVPLIVTVAVLSLLSLVTVVQRFAHVHARTQGAVPAAADAGARRASAPAVASLVSRQ